MWVIRQWTSEPVISFNLVDPRMKVHNMIVDFRAKGYALRVMVF